MYHVDVDKLNGKITERQTTKEAVADGIGVDRSTFYRRLKANRLLVRDAHKICDYLRLNEQEAIDIFLAK